MYYHCEKIDCEQSVSIRRRTNQKADIHVLAKKNKKNYKKLNKKKWKRAIQSKSGDEITIKFPRLVN